MKICITRGVYGFRENGCVVEKTSSSAPFEVDEEEGGRLIALNVAKEIIEDEISDKEKSAEDTAEDAPGIPGHISKDSLKSMKKEELYKLAEELGVRKSGSKEELAERLSQYPVWDEDEEASEDTEEVELTAEEPE